MGSVINFLGKLSAKGPVKELLNHEPNWRQGEHLISQQKKRKFEGLSRFRTTPAWSKPKPSEHSSDTSQTAARPFQEPHAHLVHARLRNRTQGGGLWYLWVGVVTAFHRSCVFSLRQLSVSVSGELASSMTAVSEGNVASNAQLLGSRAAQPEPYVKTRMIFPKACNAGQTGKSGMIEIHLKESDHHTRVDWLHRQPLRIGGVWTALENKMNTFQ